MRQSLLLLLLFLLLQFPVQAQYEPYKITGPIDGSIFGGIALTFGTSILLDSKVIPFEPEELDGISAPPLLRVDLWSTKQYSNKSRKLSDFLLRTSAIAPLSLMIDRNSKNDLGTIGLLTIESFLINAGITNLTKVTVKRTRPFIYNPDVPIEAKLKKDSRYSFFSGHTSTTAAMYFLGAQMFSDFYPDSNLKPVVWSVAGIVPAITAYARMRAGKHFFTDVLLGYLVGAAIGIVLPVLHRK